jgi:predicted enzyme related to lactoylglutathione lyase
MISKLAMVSILVQDQDEALRFYTEKLGLEKRADKVFGPGMRLVTVAPKGQKGPEIALAKPDATLHGEEKAKALLGCIGQGTMWVFDTDDCRKTYETLRSRGVPFVSPPTQQAYGIEAVFEDPYGNTFALLEPSPEILAQLMDDKRVSNLLWVA